jgi:uncharacterized membrane protein YiaA
MPASQKNYLVGGIVLCVLPAMIVLVLQIEGTPLPMPYSILCGLFFIHGLRAIFVSLFQADLDGAGSWMVDAVSAAGLSVFAFWVALYQKEGWGGIPLVPDSWNQNAARLLFGCGGFVAAAIAVRLCRKALNRSRGKPDDSVRHI